VYNASDQVSGLTGIHHAILAILTHRRGRWQRSAPGPPASPSPRLRRIADALGMAVDYTAWVSLAPAARFEAKPSRAEEPVPEVNVPGRGHDNGELFPTGTGGQWRTLLCDTRS
jgi:hypothetical protein